MADKKIFSRRKFLSGAGLLGLCSISACTDYNGINDWASNKPIGNRSIARPPIGIDSNFTSPNTMYASVNEKGHHLEAIPYKEIPKQYLRQIVPNPTGEAPGTIVIDTRNYFLYYTQPNGDALRYGVGVGKSGFEWSGRANVQYKKAWPVWTPPREMIGRQPELVKYANGMQPGSQNPLGARALYIYQNGHDTIYRIHGSPEWWTIGTSVSSGCIRLMNQDIIDLYNRVPANTPIVVL